MLGSMWALAFLMLTGCTMDLSPPGPTRTETSHIELDKSEMVRVELKMGAGELHVRGGSTELMEGEFRFSRPALRPAVRYDSSGFRGHLTVEEPSHGDTRNRGDYAWDFRFNDDKPIDMSVHFGAGEARLDLGTLTLRSLDVHMGVGQLRLDLRGTPKRDYDVDVRGGVGEATVYLPATAGIVAEAHGGLGGIRVRGLRQSDGRYVNDAYGHSKSTIRVDIRGGIGAINLIAE